MAITIWQPTPVLLPGKSHGWRSLVGCSPWGRKESGTTERLHVPFSLSCIGEGIGNPLQCSCLENPRDGGAWSMGSHRVGHDWSDLAAAAGLHWEGDKLAFPLWRLPRWQERQAVQLLRWILKPLSWAGTGQCTSACWCSGLEKPRDGGTWWAARVYGVAQSRTRL